MNLEKAIEFILDQAAKTEVHLAALSQNQAKIERNLAETSSNLAETSSKLAEVSRNQAKTDKQVAATAALVKAGMKLVIRQETTFNTKLSGLAAAQQRTDRALAQLIAGLKQKPNGRQH